MSMRSERIFTVEIVIGRGADYKLDSSIELESLPHDITVTNWELVTKVLKKTPVHAERAERKVSTR